MKKYKNVALPEEKHKKLKVKATREKKTMVQFVVERCEI